MVHGLIVLLRSPIGLTARPQLNGRVWHHVRHAALHIPTHSAGGVAEHAVFKRPLLRCGARRAGCQRQAGAIRGRCHAERGVCHRAYSAIWGAYRPLLQGVSRVAPENLQHRTQQRRYSGGSHVVQCAQGPSDR